MITPRFTCSQTDASVVISVYCPSIRAADVEIHVDETLVSFHVNPYFLRLNFSHPLLEDDTSSANYDPSSGYLTVTLTKETKGQEFKDLDLLTKLLAPRKTKVEPTIEVLSSQENEEEELVSKVDKLSLEQNEILEAAENDWQLPQQLPQDEPLLDASLQKYYGFLDTHSGYFNHVTHTENEINELGVDAETCSPDERRRRRIQHENEKWDEEYYMADFADDEYIQELIKYTHPHIAALEEVKYTEAENLTMMRLPRKEYLPSPIQTHCLYLTLITLLFSYAYESRTTQHDPTPESAWTICNLTPAFSALDPPNTNSLGLIRITDLNTFSLEEIAATIIPSYRRTLAFPLYRSFALAETCRKDVSGFLLKGKRTVVRCLLEMKDILDHHEVYYVYNKVWVDDFCSWTQAHASDDTLKGLGELLGRTEVDKGAIGWNLEELEAATRDILGREADSDDE
ncbi:SHQ1-domain-containing protein [Macrolepiota fuliginosa MF-IS2]|uniref:SHQ1-domain-containing protein n=1 Tax=Macrolepiota fuliginosa MF-IS2 TaxID=1400762 RepID=A0A9P6C5A7_9AGAR|nr:SHQ1-domain-containing protein [Macrolepiota fuliginosa MF-IS2]